LFFIFYVKLFLLEVSILYCSFSNFYEMKMKACWSNYLFFMLRFDTIMVYLEG